MTYGNGKGQTFCDSETFQMAKIYNPVICQQIANSFVSGSCGTRGTVKLAFFFSMQENVLEIISCPNLTLKILMTNSSRIAIN